MNSVYRICTRCKQNQVSTEKATMCRECNRQRQRDYYKQNPEKIKQIVKTSRKRNGYNFQARPTIPRVCVICQKDFLALKQSVKNGGALTCSRTCFHLRYSLLRRTYEGEAPTRQSAAYQEIHRWIKKELGEPSLCDFCGTTEGSIDWSNVTGEYRRELTDWQRLCRPCHKRYDDQLRELLKAST